MVTEIAIAAGTVKGMVGGQVADLEAEGKPVSPEMLEYIHRSKTAGVDSRFDHRRGHFALERRRTTWHGCGGSEKRLAGHSRLRTIFWTSKSPRPALGKTAGKDIAQQKATYPAVYGKGIAERDWDGFIFIAMEEQDRKV